MSNRKKYLIKAISFLLIFCILLSGLTAVFQKKWIEAGSLGDTYIMEGFHALEPDSIELAFLGNSQMIRGVSSMHLLEQYGISAYSAATGSQPSLCMYYEAQQLVRKQHLKAAVIDVSFLYETIRKTTVRRVIDTAPFSLNKYEMLANYMKIIIYQYGLKESMRHFWTLVFPMVQFHERWKELSKDDFLYRENEPYVFRGNTCRLVTQQVPDMLIEGKPENKEDDLRYNQEKYLKKTIRLLQDNGIDVILIKTPKYDWTRARMQGAKKIADDCGVPYIDFNTEENFTAAGLNTETDFADKEHLNYDGAIKLTDYLAGYLQEQTEFTKAEPTGQDQKTLAQYHAVLDRWNAMTQEERLLAGSKVPQETSDTDQITEEI